MNICIKLEHVLSFLEKIIKHQTRYHEDITKQNSIIKFFTTFRRIVDFYCVRQILLAPRFAAPPHFGNRL